MCLGARAYLGGGLEDDSVAGHQGWRNLGDGQVDRVVKGWDAEDDAKGDLQAALGFQILAVIAE